MRILHTVAFYPPDDGGGAGEVVRRVSEGLVELGHEVTVATSYSPARTEFVRNGVRIEQFDVRPVFGQSIIGIRGEKAKYQHFLQTNDFDVIMNYAAQTWHADLAFPVLDTLRAKTVLAACGYSGLLAPRSLLYKRYFRQLPETLRKYSAIVYHSAQYHDKEFGDRHGIAHFRIIPNGADASEMERCRVDFRAKYHIRTRHVLLAVGNHFSNKGHSRVIEAFRILGRDDTSLVIIGRDLAGPFRSCWRECQRVAAREPRVVIIANAPREDVVAAYRTADVFVSGSRTEAFPLVIVEAMAAGVPFVAFPAGNVSELPGGIVVTSTEQMAEHLSALLERPAERATLGRAGRHEQQARYEWSAIVRQYETLYLDLMHRTGTRFA